MIQKTPVEIRIDKRISNALNEQAPVVALESTVIAHGLPYPLNLETALACEEVVRRRGVIPATIGIVDGIPKIGLSEDEIAQFATATSTDGRQIEKVGLNNLAAVILRRLWGATTAGASLRLAHTAGIRVFSTGGIGGVHRGVGDSLDISGDLTALGDTPVICVCAGAKAILDLGKTLEYLETLGVPVIGYRTEAFPAFYSRSSGLPLDLRVETQGEVAELAAYHWQMGSSTSVLVCVPVPGEREIPIEVVIAATEDAMALAASREVRGKAVTPFLLAEMEKLTGGKTLSANRALLVNNAEVAALIALSLAQQGQMASTPRQVD